MDYIQIKGLKIFAHHGVFEEEKHSGQYFIVDATLYLDIHDAAVSDDLDKSEDYGRVAVFVSEFLTGNTFDLIETVADRLANNLLREFRLVKKVDITIHKPSAPIPMEFEDVTISVSRKWHRAYVAIGSNIGDKESYIQNALCKLKDDKNINNLRTSTMIITKPYGGVEQDDFINGVIELDTLYTPEELLDSLHKIENENGRVRAVHWGPRTLDLDIIFYDDIVLSTETLTIPHEDMQNRDFVLKPMMELAPDYVNHKNGKTVKQMYEELVVTKIGVNGN